MPVAVTVPPMTPLSRKQSRNLPNVQVSPALTQSLFVPQPRNVSMVQKLSNGPPAQVPSLPLTQEPPGHSASQLPPGHSESTVQSASTLAPPTQWNAPSQF